jgi:hypothetical protein
MTFEYSEFEFKLESNLDEESGDKELAFDLKKESRKSRASVPFISDDIIAAFFGSRM